jgi:hypothetical protein
VRAGQRSNEQDSEKEEKLRFRPSPLILSRHFADGADQVPLGWLSIKVFAFARALLSISAPSTPSS